MTNAHPSEIDDFDAWESRPLSERARPQPPYLPGLNEAQREAVELLDGPVLVLAGAGTGKTRVLTTRLAHLINQQRAFPSQILAVTFTNKAAREMKERVAQLLGNAVEGMPWLGTFHSICVKILRRHAELVELKPNFTILDSDDQLRLIRQLLDAEGVDDKRWPARMFAAQLDRWKNRAQGPGQVPADETGFGEGRGVEFYRMYQERLRTLNAVDFGDLLLHVVTIFQHHPDVLADYQRRFRYILVDEYQDTNVAQYLWLRLLAAQHRNICCVGDDDQSIYGWRGAEVGNILRFERDFPSAQVIRLEQNYRSTPHILAAASGVIAANRERLGKTLWTDADAGERVRLIGHWDGEEEARWIGEEIEALARGTRGHDALSLDEIAILVRASFQMRAFEDRFLAIGLPYRVIGGPRFYERMEIRDAMAYFRIVVSPDDGLAFERIVNTPKRGLGDKAIQRLNQLARERGTNLLEAARIAAGGGEGITRKGASALGQLVGQIDRWAEMLRGTEVSHVELAEIILDESGYTAMWQADRSAEAPGRLENLKELVQALEEFENLQGFLEHVSLVMDNERDDAGAKVSIMTLHGAKGLEFPAVFLPGWEDGLFPSQRSMDENGVKGLEEERRLAYVGLTRARRHLTISFAANRHIYGRWQSSLPSRFIDELPPETVEVLTPPGLYGGGYGAAAAQEMTGSTLERAAAEASTYNSPGWKRMAERRASAGAGQGRGAHSPVVNATASARFETGTRVFHQKFGYGRITGIEGDKLSIAFEKAGEKKVVASYVTPAENQGGSEDIPF
ncbi:UvrD-helicase domain-containing protein [Limibaculum sp. M0105]|uniref:DNA 3'-5' helicase n=1 Tax=Thermohalobaculum xanthum TaxID=2753746 RepID=A0A8J7M6U5_9RHOB|nr:UvrD-helicase domain-containing protein [Thermohalobaculum xanthum]MBK0399336.1 UvrD-helicase domain-containing protein [Thermohalobaculum xanthum]